MSLKDQDKDRKVLIVKMESLKSIAEVHDLAIQDLIQELNNIYPKDHKVWTYIQNRFKGVFILLERSIDYSIFKLKD